MNKKNDFENKPTDNVLQKTSGFSGTTATDLTTLSPYLNYNPAYLPPISQPEFIFLDGAAKQRGRFELAFCQIGAACFVGAGIGGFIGLNKALKNTALSGEVGKLKRTQLINHVMKHGSSLANTFGVISLMYSGFGVLFSWARDVDDNYNTILASTATGMLFKSTAGFKKCVKSGCVGLGIATIYSVWENREILANLRRHVNLF